MTREELETLKLLLERFRAHGARRHSSQQRVAEHIDALTKNLRTAIGWATKRERLRAW